MAMAMAAPIARRRGGCGTTADAITVVRRVDARLIVAVAVVVVVVVESFIIMMMLRHCVKHVRRR